MVVTGLAQFSAKLHEQLSQPVLAPPIPAASPVRVVWRCFDKRPPAGTDKELAELRILEFQSKSAKFDSSKYSSVREKKWMGRAIRTAPLNSIRGLKVGHFIQSFRDDFCEIREGERFFYVLNGAE